MKRVLEHPQSYAAVMALAQAVVGLPLTPNRAIIIEYPSPMLWHGISLLTEICNGLGLHGPGDFRDWIALLATPLIRWPLPLPPELQIDAALITDEGRPTALAASLAKQAGNATIAKSTQSRMPRRIFIHRGQGTVVMWEIEMSEQQRRYQELRGVLEGLVDAWPAGHASAVYAATITFLYTHCAGCGAPLGSSENALLRELELGDLSAWGPCAVEFDYPMCGDCYASLARSSMDVLVYDGSVLHNMRALNPAKRGTTWPFGAVHKPPREWSPTVN